MSKATNEEIGCAWCVLFFFQFTLLILKIGGGIGLPWVWVLSPTWVIAVMVISAVCSVLIHPHSEPSPAKPASDRALDDL